MKKEEIIAKLEEAGIEHDPKATKAELEELLEGEAEEEVESEEAEEEVEEEESDKDSVTVSWRGRSRVYSKERHGKDFRKLAEEFATKKRGTIA